MSHPQMQSCVPSPPLTPDYSAVLLVGFVLFCFVFLLSSASSLLPLYLFWGGGISSTWGPTSHSLSCLIARCNFAFMNVSLPRQVDHLSLLMSSFNKHTTITRKEKCVCWYSIPVYTLVLYNWARTGLKKKKTHTEYCINTPDNSTTTWMPLFVTDIFISFLSCEGMLNVHLCKYSLCVLWGIVPWYCNLH